ncbi:MAG: hypothetical protein GTO45_24660 [Candidatus Aminicenantes bacterium]|nr:hypothetical protein [Candidatus Aminicenantes bacterium]NIN21324.1 hypothetical protein [Candidatus Aminicenantes bacterium]NIN45145.1 hypothetical protein [Candidatus Aminicenantes bacterium]NIN87962.1 hypothetical protein [Candidatus Aminicenantes bacterium]NIO84253.1 hypothetical protein [Candidatus Aminicenantes bacterium]
MISKKIEMNSQTFFPMHFPGENMNERSIRGGYHVLFEKIVVKGLWCISLAIIILLAASCSSVESDWEEACKKNTVEAYEHFLDSHPKAPKLIIKKAYERIAWAETKQIDTPGEYLMFNNDYPESEFRDECMERLNWASARKKNTIRAYEKFISDNPMSKYTSRAKELLKEVSGKMETDWQEAVKSNSYDVYASFIRKYISEHRVFEAHNRLMLIAEKKWRTLLKKLRNINQTGKPALSSVPTDFHLVLVPRLKRLLFIQEYIRPGSLSESSQKPNLYIIYNYDRGINLGSRSSYSTTATYLRTQELWVFAKLIFSQGDTIEVIGKFTGHGGLGSRTFEDIVKNTFKKFKKLGLPKNIQGYLESIIGYSTGLYRYPGFQTRIQAYIAAYILKKAPYWSDKWEAKLLLTQIKDPDAVEPLIALLNDKEANVTARGIAAHSLANIEDNRVVEPLIAALKDKQSGVRQSAAQSLRIVKAPRAVEPLIAALKDKDSGVRMSAASSLGFIKDPQAVEPLIAALKDKQSKVRRLAAFSLGEIQDPSAVKPLIAALKDEDEKVRRSAAISLGKIRDSHAVESLIRALKDRSKIVRQAAAESMGEIKNPLAIEPLVAALKDNSSDVRKSAAEALEKLGWDSKNVNKRVILLIHKRNWDECIKIGEPAVKPLIATLKDKDRKVRRGVAYALGEIKDPRAVEPLIMALKDKDFGVRSEAAISLGQIKDPRAIEPLIAALKETKYLHEAVLSLKEITGKDFDSYPQWYNWWKKRQKQDNQ